MTSSNKENNHDQPKADELISLHEAAKTSGLSPSYLRILVREGIVWGKKLGRNWVTTEKAVREYQARKRRPGRPPKNKKI